MVRKKRLTMKLTIKDIILIVFASISLILTIVLLTRDDSKEDILKAEIQALKAKQQLYKDSIVIIDNQRAEAYKELIIIGNQAEALEAKLELSKLEQLKKSVENEKNNQVIIPDSSNIDSIFSRILQGR